MSVNLHVGAKVHPMSFKDFIETSPGYSVALDGYVAEGPKFVQHKQLGGLVVPYANFNHHEGVSRLETRSTCAQVLLALRMGLFDAFREDGERQLTAYVNDCDEDVSLSWFLLSHAHIAEVVMNPILNRLVAVEDFLDTTAGAYPLSHNLPLLEELAWVFDPYRQFRQRGGLERRDDDAFAGIIEDVGNRIEKHIVGSGKRLKLDTEWAYWTDKRNPLHAMSDNHSWHMVKEIGRHARLSLFSMGVRAYVSVSQQSDNRWRYTVGRVSPFIPFDVPAILASLNDAERTTTDRWGGSDLVGGSPRVDGSVLTPIEVAEVVNDVLRRGPQALSPADEMLSRL